MMAIFRGVIIKTCLITWKDNFQPDSQKVDHYKFVCLCFLLIEALTIFIVYCFLNLQFSKREYFAVVNF